MHECALLRKCVLLCKGSDECIAYGLVAQLHSKLIGATAAVDN